MYEKKNVAAYKKYFIFLNFSDEALTDWEQEKEKFIELAKDCGSVKIAENIREQLQLENAAGYQRVIELWLENDTQIEELVASKKLESFLSAVSGENVENMITLCANENYVIPE